MEGDNPLFKKSKVRGRERLGYFLNRKRLRGDAVEVGTHLGEFAAALLGCWEGRRLYCVDPWDDPPEYQHPLEIINGRDREADYAACQKRLAAFGERVCLMRMTSELAAPMFAAGSLSFVYLDANHKRKFVEQDIALWWPKIRRRGVLAGHDVICPGEKGGGWGVHVRPAVEAFAQREGVTVQLIEEPDGGPWSWFVRKGIG